MGNDDQFLFSEAEDELVSEELEQWNILIVDDDKDIHRVTQFVLSDFNYLGKSLNFINAYSAEEAREIFRTHTDIAVVFLDVVMESNHAGLEFVDWLRMEFGNTTSRIILRTGQPGDAPESEVIKKYEINDYKNKTELTATKLNTTLCAALRSYRDIMVIENTKKGLNTIINSSASILVEADGTHWLDGILSQLSALLQLGEVHAFNFAAQEVQGKWQVVASSKGGEALIGKNLNEFISCSIEDVANSAERYIRAGEEEFLIPVKVNKSVGLLVVHCPEKRLNENIEILDLFIRNITIAYEKVILLNEVRDTQKEIAYRLGEVVETRSKESGSHVKRVAEISMFLGLKYGLSEEFAAKIRLASPLHDIGKIAIPDAVLNKPGKLDSDEWNVMMSHAEVGAEILRGSNLEILNIAANIAAYHHEKWDGSGYPTKISGEDIPIEARITAVADVFDALASKRCYKDPWPAEKIYDLIKSEHGKHFDPRLVDIFLENFDELQQIRNSYPD
ncbi:HD domain-containing phosphohydrolase [Vibrio sp. SCSIO 43136]|uniref:HD domain-containing phosphohydrolase n=1 Tax=Vibrio sp. SCSIO 43136 TaxID=2819101 RepID=UPI002074D052|nr:HD domain-containing phosphohydrolase [Vibrio sp. SCSIO 43136]USD66950.1 DUF3369 domain-containing protein [Vibrio sp. SCSIO 43136]